MLITFELLFDKIMSYHHFINVKYKRGGGGRMFGPQASTKVRTNYPDSLSPDALNQTLITREPTGAIIKAFNNVETGLCFRTD